MARPYHMYIQINNLLSLSNITTPALLGSPAWILNCNESFTIDMLNVSSGSDSISSVIGILAEEQVAPAGNVKRYCVLSASL